MSTVVAPALLALLGPNVNRWTIGSSGETGVAAVMNFVDAALRRPVFATVVIGGIVLVLAAPAFGLKTGPPSTEQLPEDNDVREDFDVVQEAIGPGYEAPFVVVAGTEDGTMTERKRLDQLAKWQRKIAKDPAVQAVIGPEQVAKRTEPLKNTGNELRTSNEKGGDLYELNRLGPGLDRAANGVSQIRSGLARAAGGRRPAGEGSGNAEEGALQIADGLGQAIEGGDEAVERDHQDQRRLGRDRKGLGGTRRRPGRSEDADQGARHSSTQRPGQARPRSGAGAEQEADGRTESLAATNPELAKAAEKARNLSAYIDNLQGEAPVAQRKRHERQRRSERTASRAATN